MLNKKLGLAGLPLLATFMLAGCGQTVDPPSSWFQVDQASQTVTMKVIGGYNSSNSYMNFNGASHGQIEIDIPVGYHVKIDFENKSGIPQDIGIYDGNRKLAFKGAGDSISAIQGNAGAGVMPGDSQTYKFDAAQAGTYRLASMLYYFPNDRQRHQDLGMWAVFKVVDGGQPSVQIK
ncbi:hypothetical protein LSG31_18460 [Fodinisporobacter ferrooxydans]|uniref:Sulfocyanin-like C-terminal domain-containing protein n=1 Tax=Fodinisporobacter ferrooxydans TaxID=2901836 RepID=A0ABY4CHR7_9BACL|nr:hypothetical protein LSG31_18460 [Alicyclobacillaceae bacterium MYW30-H2]